MSLALISGAYEYSSDDDEAGVESDDRDERETIPCDDDDDQNPETLSVVESEVFEELTRELTGDRWMAVEDMLNLSGVLRELEEVSGQEIVTSTPPSGGCFALEVDNAPAPNGNSHEDIRNPPPPKKRRSDKKERKQSSRSCRRDNDKTQTGTREKRKKRDHGHAGLRESRKVKGEPISGVKEIDQDIAVTQNKACLRVEDSRAPNGNSTEGIVDQPPPKQSRRKRRVGLGDPEKIDYGSSKKKRRDMGHAETNVSNMEIIPTNPMTPHPIIQTDKQVNNEDVGNEGQQFSTVDAIFLCPHCYEQFVEGSQLIAHLETHDDNRSNQIIADDMESESQQAVVEMEAERSTKPKKMKKKKLPHTNSLEGQCVSPPGQENEDHENEVQSINFPFSQLETHDDNRSNQIISDDMESESQPAVVAVETERSPQPKKMRKNKKVSDTRIVEEHNASPPGQEADDHADEAAPPKRNLLCVICGEGFARSYDLQNHMDIHTGDKAFKCPLCNERFQEVIGVENHLRDIHRKGEDVSLLKLLESRRSNRRCPPKKIKKKLNRSTIPNNLRTAKSIPPSKTTRSNRKLPGRSGPSQSSSSPIPNNLLTAKSIPLSKTTRSNRKLPGRSCPSRSSSSRSRSHSRRSEKILDEGVPDTTRLDKRSSEHTAIEEPPMSIPPPSSSPVPERRVTRGHVRKRKHDADNDNQIEERINLPPSETPTVPVTQVKVGDKDNQDDDDQEPFPCPFCSKVFGKSDGLIGHLPSHENNLPEAGSDNSKLMELEKTALPPSPIHISEEPPAHSSSPPSRDYKASTPSKGQHPIRRPSERTATASKLRDNPSWLKSSGPIPETVKSRESRPMSIPDSDSIVNQPPSKGIRSEQKERKHSSRSSRRDKKKIETGARQTKKRDPSHGHAGVRESRKEKGGAADGNSNEEIVDQPPQKQSRMNKRVRRGGPEKIDSGAGSPKKKRRDLGHAETNASNMETIRTNPLTSHSIIETESKFPESRSMSIPDSDSIPHSGKKSNRTRSRPSSSSIQATKKTESDRELRKRKQPSTNPSKIASENAEVEEFQVVQNDSRENPLAKDETFDKRTETDKNEKLIESSDLSTEPMLFPCPCCPNIFATTDGLILHLPAHEETSGVVPEGETPVKENVTDKVGVKMPRSKRSKKENVSTKLGLSSVSNKKLSRPRRKIAVESKPTRIESPSNVNLLLNSDRMWECITRPCHVRLTRCNF